MIDAAKKERAIVFAKELLNELNDSMHGVAHMESVIGYCDQISKAYPMVDLEILELAVWWHDVGRIFVDEGHAEKSSQMVREELKKIGIESAKIEQICDVIESHSNRGLRSPQTIEAKILKDADKLDFLTVDRWKVGIAEKRGKEIGIGVKKIPAIGKEILILPESKEIFKVLFDKLVIFIRATDNSFLNQFKPEIIKNWQVFV